MGKRTSDGAELVRIWLGRIQNAATTADIRGALSASRGGKAAGKISSRALISIERAAEAKLKELSK